MAGCAEYSAEYSPGSCYCTVLGGSSEGPLLEYESGVEERGISCIINHLLTTREREREILKYGGNGSGSYIYEAFALSMILTR